MVDKNNYRALSQSEILDLEARGCRAESWQRVMVCDDFGVDQLWRVRFEGDIYIDHGATIVDSAVRNYHLGPNSRVESVVRLECRSMSRFGNGVEVATINECGGRTVKIYDQMRAQVAYVWATYRHREDFCRAIGGFVECYARGQEAQIGYVGEGSQIVGSRFVREVRIGRGVKVEGASLLSNATLCDGAYVGIDVKAQNMIVAEGAKIDTGATLERCFVGECAIVANGFTAVDSLIFANSHLENGEAASIFAGPYSVSHHKSSLLIAGMFSFFNAGSGSNQSNHLFKTGAVHQSIHPRGCKFASGAYIMAPAIEGAYTMVKGHHSKHHDTLAFPFSYLVDDPEGHSILMPGANLVSYGTCRDIGKWAARDRREVKRDVINFEEYNPYITSMMISAVNTIHTMMEENPEADQYMWNRVIIKPSHLKRGLGLYNKAIVASLGDMLSSGDGLAPDPTRGGEGVWIDAAGQYISASAVEEMICGVEGGSITTLEGVDSAFAEFGRNYLSYAYSYGYWLLSGLLGHQPTAEEVAEAVESAKGSREALTKMVRSDMNKDCGKSMAVGYGLHATSEAEVEADYNSVRGL